MKGIFDLSSKEFHEFLWSLGPYKGYKGKLMKDSSAISVSGGFGNMMFQKVSVPLFDIWMSDYWVISDFEARARAPYRSIELSFNTASPIVQGSIPFGDHHWKTNEINFSHLLAIDSKVQFERDKYYKSFDIHYSAKSLEKLMVLIPDLIEPFLNEYEANRQMQLFKEGIAPDFCISGLANEIYNYVCRPDMTPEYLESLGLLLLTKIFLYKKGMSSRKGLNKNELELLQNVQEVKKALLWEIDLFERTKYYANTLAYTNETDFREHFKKVADMSAFAYWRHAKLDNALYLLLNSNKSINSITSDAGYISSKAFCKEFKKIYGVSPSGYRKIMSSISCHHL